MYPAQQRHYLQKKVKRGYYYSPAAEHGALVTKTNANLRVHWCKNGLWSTEMWRIRWRVTHLRMKKCMCDAQMVDPCSDGCRWLWHDVRDIFLAWYGSTLVMLMKHLLGWLEGLVSMEMMWMSSGLHCHRISTHLNACGRMKLKLDVEHLTQTRDVGFSFNVSPVCSFNHPHHTQPR